ncbi:U8 snoRNA-decapping enzyme-like [Aplysia californica]|uniref:U8 snoRNA-decapping enzyme n=1 Tax=Aplysia californica TaxID=6500 RepID=A0ABM1VS77_APLCA|nr:U8 snoRNA-decapping enzyme-like [Aplysia californica]XP_035825270.1 U8 snoRNA-decapping enzyme-like [Aplysia californica]
MADIGWGWLASMESYGALGDTFADYKTLTEEEIASKKYSSLRHAAHGMIFARKNKLLWDLYDMLGLVMMQMRFDGVLGFPGGLVDEGETPVEAVNREMKEEICLDLDKYSFSEDHCISIQLNEKKGLVLYFYQMEVSCEDFVAMEHNIINAPDFGVETLGVLRVPLYTMGDGRRGFPAFLDNQFAGNAKYQLIHGLKTAKLLSDEQISKAVNSCSQK